MANFRYSHLFTTKIGNAAIEAAAAKLNAAEIALAIADGEEKILFKNENGDVISVATEEQIINIINQAVTNETARATSAETELQNAIDALESGSTEAVEAERQRALSAETDLLDIIEDEVAERKAGAVASIEYDASGKTIDFYNANNVKIDSIDATAFIKDGMIDSVTLVTESGTTYLVIVWNTDAGKEETRIDIGDLFDADNYYTKSEVNDIVSGLTDAVAEEEARAISAETALQNAIEAEETRATSAETALQNAIEAEETRATSAETALQNAIEAEAEARDDADVKSMNVDANAGITLTLGDGSTIVATEAEEITLTAGEF
jgi:hypothetical protein